MCASSRLIVKSQLTFVGHRLKAADEVVAVSTYTAAKSPYLTRVYLLKYALK